MKFDYCDLDEKDLTVCWYVDGGRIQLHFTSNLSELYSLRKLIDEMINKLVDVKSKRDEEHNKEIKKVK